ncbi:MAG: hypothetical protein HPY83_02710 [Anaerolineae bacterium]|nr:hypothetical protein [Anaerolineae bacterium]
MEFPSPAASTVTDVTFSASGQALAALYEPGGVYRASSDPSSWEWLGEDLAGLTPLSLLADGPGGCLWVGTVDGVWAACEEGTSRIPGLLGPVYSLARAPRGVWAAAEAGLFSCSAGGCERATLPTSSVLAVASIPGLVCAGTADEGLWCASQSHREWSRLEAPVGIVNDVVLGEDGWVHLISVGHLFACEADGGACREVSLPGETAAKVVARAGGTLLVGTADGGVHRSTDGGETWSAAHGPPTWPEISALAVGPEGTALAGTVGSGLLRSLDGGATWETVIEAPGRRPVLALIGAEDGFIYAGTTTGVYRAPAPEGPWRRLEAGNGPPATFALIWTGGCLYAGSAWGVHRLEEADGSWTLVTEELGRQTVFALAADPHHPSHLYAGCWGNNVLASEDGGSTWAPVHRGLETLSVHSLAVSPFEPGRLYAGTVEDLFRTRDRGETWQSCGPAPETVFALAHSPRDVCTLYAGTTTGAWRTEDCGDSWERLQLPGPVTVYSLAIPSGQPDALLAGTEESGVWFSGDEGRRWQTWGLEGRDVYSLYVGDDGSVLAGTDDGLYVTSF